MSDVWPGVLAIGIGAAVLMVDSLVPLGVAVPVAYIAAVLIGAMFGRREAFFVLAAVASILTVVGFLLSPEGNGPMWMAAANRILAVFGIWVTAVLGFQLKGGAAALEASRAELERRVKDRTRDLERVVDAEREVRTRAANHANRIRDIVEASPDAIWEIDQTGRYTFASARIEQVLGYLPEEMIGRRIFGRISEAESARLRSELRRASDARSAVDHLEISMATKDGRPIVIEMRAMPVFASDGAPRGHCGVFRDITERKARELELMKLSEIVRNSPVSVCVTDVSGRIEYVNPRFVELTGYSPEEAIGKTHAILKSGMTPRTIYEELWKKITSGQVWHGNICDKTKAGKTYWARTVISPIFSPEGKIINFIGISEDFTEQMVAQEAFLQAQKMEAIGQLAGGMANELNNLLQVIVGNFELLMGHLKDDHAVAPSFDAAMRAAHRCSGLVDRLLSISHRQVLQPRATDVGQLVMSMTTFLEWAQMEVEVVSFAGLWPAMVDARQLENALISIAINARDAMPEGGKLVISTGNVCLGAQDAAVRGIPEGEYVRITFSDTGKGMSTEVAQRAFEPFFTTKEGAAGAGLGLSIVYAFVRQTGGAVELQSEQLRGTTVTIYLPRA